MAYRVTYQCNVEWMGEGIGPMGGSAAAQVGMAPAGGAQVLALFNTPNYAGSVTKTFQAADITTLTNAIAADLAAQMTTNITRVQNFSTGTG